MEKQGRQHRTWQLNCWAPAHTGSWWDAFPSGSPPLSAWSPSSGRQTALVVQQSEPQSRVRDVGAAGLQGGRVWTRPSRRDWVSPAATCRGWWAAARYARPLRAVPFQPPPASRAPRCPAGRCVAPTIHFSSRWGREERGCAGSPNVAPVLLQTTRPQRGAAPVPGEGPPPISHSRKSVGWKEKLLSAVVMDTGTPPPSPHERRHPPRHAPSSLACR